MILDIDTLVLYNYDLVMLKLDIQRIFALRGISNPFSQLMKLGLARPTAWNLVSGSVGSIKTKHLEKICEFLNCTPNDLYQWTPSSDAKNVETHPLRGLRRDVKAARYNELIRNVPIDKIAKVEQMLTNLIAEE
jgi:DNA-binding Xre family transcriptional regulator